MNVETSPLDGIRKASGTRVEAETWALITLVATGLLTLMWIGTFAWLNAKALGLL